MRCSLRALCHHTCLLHRLNQRAEPTAGQAINSARRHRARRLRPIRLVLVGVSTGGPTTLERILSDIKVPLAAPVLIALHTPNRYLKALTTRLSDRFGHDIGWLDRPTPLAPGQIVIAGADYDVLVSSKNGQPTARPVAIDPSRNWHPSVDRMVETAMEAFPAV